MIRLGLLSELRGGDAGLDPYTEPIRRVEQPLRERGVALVRRDPDLILADAGRLEDADASCPVIAYERADGGMLWWDSASHGGRARRLLKSPRVVGMMKLTRYAHLACYNQPCAEDAYHIQRIYEAADGALPRTAPPAPIALGENDLRKIEVGYGFWAFQVCDPLPDYRIDGGGGKDLDVFCAMTTDYASPGVTHHRRLAMERLERLGRPRTVLVRGCRLPAEEYRGLMRRSRVCVSPWGWGETTIRDYEAMYAGCVLIKPRTDFIHSWPAVDERHYVPCAVDFSDLAEKIDFVLAHWDSFLEMRRLNRERLLALRRPEALADRLAALVRRWAETIA